MEELSQQLKSWLDYEHRTRRVCHQDRQNGKCALSVRCSIEANASMLGMDFELMTFLSIET